MGLDLLRPDPERHGALRMPDAARPVLRGAASVPLRKDVLKPKARVQVKTLVSEEDAPLLSALKAKRRAFAEDARVPAYVIFNDRTLIEMAETRTETLDQMARISGVGAKKLERYGAAFLEVITGASVAEAHPARRKLSGRDAGEVYDALLRVQADLSRGETGLEKPMSCPANLLARVAKTRPDDLEHMRKLLGERRADRFGEAFLDIVKTAS